MEGHAVPQARTCVRPRSGRAPGLCCQAALPALARPAQRGGGRGRARGLGGLSARGNAATPPEPSLPARPWSWEPFATLSRRPDPCSLNVFHLSRFLLALVDPSPGVRQLAEFLLTDTLATKAPLLAYNHFVESLFVLNGCAAGLYAARVGASLAGAPEGGEGAGGAGATGAAPAQFTLRGAANRWAGTFSRLSAHTLSTPRLLHGPVVNLAAALSPLPPPHTQRHTHARSSTPLRLRRPQRDMIYRALLRHMSTEHKFSTSAKLANEVGLGGAGAHALAWDGTRACASLA